MIYYSKRLTVLPPVTGFGINPALIVHLLIPLWNILARRHFKGAHMQHQEANNVCKKTYWVPIYTWWRAGMWISVLQCLQLSTCT